MASKKILLVEDIYFNQILIESLLVEWGYQVIIVDDGAQALDEMIVEKPDLIILDLMMPVMDGFQFLEEKNKLRDETPVVILSARTDMDSINRALKLGAKDYITKPFNSNDLENKISVFLPKL
ncbi:MAG TPA: response regulator [Tenuifilaceae bacterium]|nr:response regulator [Tenuifilaceae bacterium]